MAAPRPQLSFSDWLVLAVVAERPTHGWPVVRELSAQGELGRIWTVARPVVYRSLATLAAHGMVTERGEQPGLRGPERTIVAVTRRGRAALRRWLDTPVGHVRDVRSELLVKLALRERAGLDSQVLVEQQLDVLAPVLRAVTRPPRGTGFERVLATWRREQARAVERFLRAQLG